MAAEYDFIVVNGEEVIVIEVKTAVSTSKLDTFINKLNIFKKYFPEYSEKKVYGAVAYIKATKELLESAKEKGLFLIQAPGCERIVSPFLDISRWL